MDFGRLLRHVFMTDFAVKRAFPAASLERIEQQIGSSEASQAGELRFVVEGGLSGAQVWFGLPSRERAIDVFSQLRMWDTAQRNGVLVYLLLADHSVEIVADRGVSGKVDAAQWEGICQDMEKAFSAGQFEQGALDGVRQITALLVQHYPADGARANELPDKVVLL